jgi:intracellular septation protein
MKLWFHFLPLILFIATFQFAEEHRDAAAALINDHLATAAWTGDVSPGKAPVLLATAAVVLAALVQAGWLTVTGRKVQPVWWVSLGLVLLLGGMTLWLHNPTFNKWKPSALYWAMGTTLWLSPLLFGRNLLKSLLGAQMTLPPRVWHRLNFAWVAFFAGMGLLNLWVAHAYSVETRAAFKVFGSLGLMLAFTVAQALVLSRCVKEAAAPDPSLETR